MNQFPGLSALALLVGLAACDSAEPPTQEQPVQNQTAAPETAMDETAAADEPTPQRQDDTTPATATKLQPAPQSRAAAPGTKPAPIQAPAQQTVQSPTPDAVPETDPHAGHDMSGM